MATPSREPRTRGYRKKERTRRQLVAAGLRVLADKGQGLTVSDVVAEAEVSNGTFYNYFADRDALLAALAEHSTLSLAAAAAAEPIDDPARRFALATASVLCRARDDETWARVLLRLVSRPASGVDLARYLREDLDEGFARGRFEVGADDAALDQVAGLIVMTLRRLVEPGASGAACAPSAWPRPRPPSSPPKPSPPGSTRRRADRGRPSCGGGPREPAGTRHNIWS